jgi:cytochrome c biogenesis factor
MVVAWIVAIVGILMFISGLSIAVTSYYNTKSEVYLIFIGLIVFLIGSFWVLSIHDKHDRDACQAIGGKYVVVDHETTLIMSGKVLVPVETDVYGCVK